MLNQNVHRPSHIRCGSPESEFSCRQMALVGEGSPVFSLPSADMAMGYCIALTCQALNTRFIFRSFLNSRCCEHGGNEFFTCVPFSSWVEAGVGTVEF